MMQENKFVNTEELRIERLRKQLTYKNMAEKLGFRSQVSYSNIEKGKVIPKIEQMIQISQILGKPTEYFFNIKVQQR